MKSIAAALVVVLASLGQGTKPPSDVDSLVAPIALYPDQLLAPILVSAGDPPGVQKLAAWLKANAKLKGTDLQDAAVKAGFEPHFVALALFPTVVNTMAEKIEWTTLVGRIFQIDRNTVFASIQKLRAQAQAAGTLKSSPQQSVETTTTDTGQQVIVIEPTNPQVVYVPQYNSTTVYVEHEDHSGDAAAAAAIGFTAGIVIGAAVSNPYYYGPYGWHGGAYMYNDDYWDHREDARDDWMDHREDMYENRSDRAEEARENRSDRAENAADSRSDRAANRSASGTRAENQSAGTRTQTQSAGTRTQTQSAGTRAQTQSSGSRGDAFSGYSSGKSERAASTRGNQSRGSSRSGGSRSGGGRRR